MFKEKFLIFKIEIPPQGPRKKIKFSDKPSLSPKKKQEKFRELKETEKRQQEEEIRVKEKLLEGIELFGIKCKRCGSKNVKEDKKALKLNPKYHNLFCLDCGYKWKEGRKN